MTQDLQRSLGRIEGSQVQILSELKQLRVDFNDHKVEDQRNFSTIRALIYSKIGEQNEMRESHLAEQDKAIAELKSDSDRAKGAGWAILGILGSAAAFIGGAILALVEGWIQLKFH